MTRLLTATLFVMPVALFVTGTTAQAQNTRDCRYYGICNSLQGYSNSYNGDKQQAPSVAPPAYPSYPPGLKSNDSNIRPETGLVGPHGSQWY